MTNGELVSIIRVFPHCKFISSIFNRQDLHQAVVYGISLYSSNKYITSIQKTVDQSKLKHSG